MALALLASSGSDGDEARIERCLGTPTQDRCLARTYAEAAGAGRVATTLRALETLARARRVDDCHLEAHRLAHAVFRVVGDVERTFLLGGPACRFGYLHGAVEASGSVAVAGATATHGVAVPRCARFRISLQRRACAHGFGHALMLRTSHDIRTSVDGCIEASRLGLDTPACAAGVMMQNSLRFAGRRDGATLAARGCEAVRASPPLERACFDNIGVVAALSLGHDDERAAAICTRLPAARERELCLAGARGEIAESRRSAGRAG